MFVLFVLFFSFLYGGEPFTRGGLVDIPCAETLEHGLVQIGISNSFYKQGYSEDIPFKNDIGTYFKIGLYERIELALCFYTIKDVVLNINCKLFEETIRYPSFAIGVQNISNNKWVRTYGTNYNKSLVFKHTNYGDQPENNAFYIVLSKTFLLKVGYIKTHLGIGNQRFIGTASLSSKFHGIFMGVQLEPISNLFISVDENGRHLNAAIEYNFRGLKLRKNLSFINALSIGIAVSKLEDLIRGQKGGTPGVDREAELGFGIKYHLGPFFQGIIKHKSKVKLITQMERQRLKTQQIADELKKIREKRLQIEKEINELKKKLMEKKAK